MKILLVCTNHAPEQTGTGKYQGEMAAWLARRGHQVRVVAAPPYYPMWKIAEGFSRWRYQVETIEGVRVYRVPLYVPTRPSGAKRLLHQASFVAAAKPLLLVLGLFWRPDVVMVTAPPLMVAPAALAAAWLAGAHTHLHVQDFEVDAAFELGLLKNPRLRRLALAIERRLLRAFATVSSITPRMREKLLAKGVDAARAFLIPNWAGVDDFDPAQGGGNWREKLGLSPATVLALYSGNLGRKQGLETLVEAARLLQDKPQIRFVISGDGAGREELVAKAAGLNNILFLPVQPLRDFIHLMIAADIHLLPQKAEIADLVMPSKLGNMLASGKPVVAGANPGTQVYATVQGCGLAVPPDDPAAFANAIATLAKDAGCRAQMGAVGQQRAREAWSKEGILPRLEALWLEFRANHPS